MGMEHKTEGKAMKASEEGAMDMKITKASHPKAVALMLSAYPNYRGRKFSVSFARQYRVWDFWDGGSRTHTTFVDLTTGKLVGSDAVPMALRQKAGNWYNLPLTEAFPLPANVGVIEHRISCGKDVGLRLVLPDPVELPEARPLTDRVLALRS